MNFLRIGAAAPQRRGRGRVAVSSRIAVSMLAFGAAAPQAQDGPAVQGGPATLPAIIIKSRPAAVLDTPASTGSNLNLSPRETPASLDIIRREQLDERGDASVLDAITRSGGISAMGHPGNGGSALSSRGFTDSTSVMRLYDGMRQYGGVGVTFPFDTWSVERIEVLRGPASVVYGDGAIGGVVNVIPRRPRQGPVENELQLTAGTERTGRFAFDSSGALTDKLAYRFDLSGSRSDNWVDRGESRDLTVSGALQWDATRDLRLTLSHAQGRQKPMRYFGTPLIEGRQADELRRKNYNVDDGLIRYRDAWTELDALWTPRDDVTVRAKLYNVRSKRDWRNAEKYVYNPSTKWIDRSDNTEINHDQKQTGLTADAAFDGRLGVFKNIFSIGFDLNRSSFRHTNNTYTGSSGPVDPYDPIPGYFHSDQPTMPRYRNEALQYAVFIEDRLELTPRWSVIAGLRHDHAKLVRDDLVSSARVLDRSYSDTGFRVGTVFQARPGLALYAQYSEAADPVSGILMLSPANAEFEMARGRQIEVGLKQSFLDGKGEWTLALYHIRKTDLLTRDAMDPARRVQVGAQSSRGIEASLSMELARGWTIEANAAMLRARYDDFTESAGSPPMAVSRSGKVPPNVAQRLANLWLGWEFAPGWTAMGGLRYVGKRYADNANTLELPSYTTTDLALRWRLDKDTTITARGYNVFDKAYFTTAYYTPTQWLYGPGRRYELTLNHRF
ncbi:MAG: TonB-dependent receptor [Alcaligenaceae bacterium]|nr:TonB-dependent receptor [Alcaligenaceae bacterium]